MGYKHAPSRDVQEQKREETKVEGRGGKVYLASSAGISLREEEEKREKREKREREEGEGEGEGRGTKAKEGREC